MSVELSQLYEHYKSRAFADSFWDTYEEMFKIIPINIALTGKIIEKMKDEYIYKKADEPKYIYYILEGCVNMILESKSKSVVSNQRKRPVKSIRITLHNATYFGEYQILANRSRCQSIITKSEKVVLLQIEKEHVNSIKYNKLEKSSVGIFQMLKSSSYQFLGKLFRRKKFKRGERLQQLYEMGVILSGEFVVKKNITFEQQDSQGHIYYFSKIFQLLTICPKQTFPTQSLEANSTNSQAWVITRASYKQIIEHDPKFKQNVQNFKERCRKDLEEIIQRIKSTYKHSKEIQRSLNLRIRHRSECTKKDEILDEKYQIKKLRTEIFEKSQKNMIHKLRKKIGEQARKIRYPDLFGEVLFKVDIQKSQESIKKKIQEIETKEQELADYEKEKKEFDKLYTPNGFGGIKKFQLKMFYKQNKGKIKTGGFSFLNERQKTCKKRRSLVILDENQN